jgi:hypothetical protein
MSRHASHIGISRVILCVSPIHNNELQGAIAASGQKRPAAELELERYVDQEAYEDSLSSNTSWVRLKLNGLDRQKKPEEFTAAFVRQQFGHYVLPIKNYIFFYLLLSFMFVTKPSVFAKKKPILSIIVTSDIALMDCFYMSILLRA